MNQKNSGQVVLAAVIFLSAIAAVMAAGFSAPVAREIRAARELEAARASYYVAESGLEDAIFRLRKSLNILPTYSLNVGIGQVDLSVDTLGIDRSVRAVGNHAARFRQLEANLKLDNTNAQFFYGVQVSDGGLRMANNSSVSGNVYSNGNIIGGSGASISGDAIVAGGLVAPPSVDSPDHDTNQPFAHTLGIMDLAQPFTAPVAGPIGRISVFLAKDGSPNKDLILKIVSDSGGLPTGNALGSVTIDRTNVGSTASWIHTSFSSTVNLAAGSRYWIVVDSNTNSADANNHWIWRSFVGSGANPADYFMSLSDISKSWSSGSGVLAHQVWVGGLNTRIEDVDVGDSTSGLARANQFVNVNVHGSACPNQYCVIDNPPRVELPISDGVIQDWRDAAETGGVCAEPLCDASGNLIVDGNLTLGPLKIPGNLTVNVGAKLTLTGTLWVVGDSDLACGNNGLVGLDAGYGAKSGLILGDGNIISGNNCKFGGSGDPASYIMILSAKHCGSPGNKQPCADPDAPVMNINNNSLGNVIYYASDGFIAFDNLSQASEATAYGIKLAPNADIIYESGLANVNFSSGPGASFAIVDWHEI